MCVCVCVYSRHSPIKSGLEITFNFIDKKRMATFYREIILSGDRFDTLRFGSLIVDWVQQQISVDKQSPASKVILLMEEILHQMIGSLSPYLQGFTHPRWCRISSINRKEKPSVQTATTVATKAILS